MFTMKITTASNQHGNTVHYLHFARFCSVWKYFKWKIDNKLCLEKRIKVNTHFISQIALVIPKMNIFACEWVHVLGMIVYTIQLNIFACERTCIVWAEHIRFRMSTYTQECAIKKQLWNVIYTKLVHILSPIFTHTIACSDTTRHS